MAVYLTNTNELTSIANAIRTKGGTSANLEYPTDFISAINALQINAMTEIIVPEQSITASNEGTRIPNFNTGLIAGEQYIFTINNERITATAATQGSSVVLFYDSNLATEYINNLMYFDVLSSSLYGTYTIKVERILTDSDYIRTVIYSLSSENCDTNLMNNAYYALISLDEPLNTSSQYIVTFDGNEYICESYTGEANWISIGDIATTTTRGAQYLNFPFYISHEQSKQSETCFAVRGTGTHTVKIEKLTLLTRGTELTTKTITANGTYDPADDDADGYSGVTVALPSGTAGTPTATKGTVSNHQVSVTPSVTNIAGVITGGTQTGTAVTVTASELASGNKEITANGTNIDVVGYSTVSVAVPSSSPTHTATLTGTSRGDLYIRYNNTKYQAGTTFDYHSGETCTLYADGVNSGDIYIDGTKVATGTPASYTYTLPEYNINVSFAYGTTGKCEVSFPEVSITTNGKHNVDGYVYANVAVPSGTPSLQAKTNISPTTSSQTITADSGYDGLSSVQINAMPTMTLPTSASSSATSGYTSKATIGRSTSNQYINIPTGYNSTGGYYTISAVANGSASGPSSVSGTSATVSTGTNTLTLTKTISITPTVSAGYVSAGTATNATVTLTGSVTTKAAATITPGTSNQTIASGTYLTGTQTISGDANLVAGNIISGKTIFGVAGSVVIQHYYTGSGTPSSSTGVNGDIYLKTS